MISDFQCSSVLALIPLGVMAPCGSRLYCRDSEILALSIFKEKL